MNKSLLVLGLVLAVLLLVSGCMRSPDIMCNYDGVCQEWETDDCPDCRNVLGRGVDILPEHEGVQGAG